MRIGASILFAILGLAAALGSVAAIVSVPDAVVEYRREPEDAVGAIFWALTLALLSAFWVRGAVRSSNRIGHPPSRPGVLAAGLVSVAGVGLAATGLFDATDARLLAASGLVCTGSAALWLWVARRP